jgi:hypothetical protein
VVTGRWEVVELAGIEGWWRRLLELVTVATGVGRRVFGSGDRRGMEWLCSRGLYIGWSRGEKVVAVSMAGGCFIITLNVAVSMRGNDPVGIGCERGRGGDRRSYMVEAAGGQAARGHRRGTRRNKIRHQWRLSIRTLGDRKGMLRRRLLKGKMKVVGRLFGSTPRAWRGHGKRQWRPVGFRRKKTVKATF